MPVLETILGGVASTLFAPKPKYVVPDYQAIRDKAEKAGFNPLTALTQGPQGSVVQGQNYMGAAISDALLIAAGDKEKDARISLLEAQTAHYRKSVENMTLRPKVGGIYGGSNDDDKKDSSGDKFLTDFLGDPRLGFSLDAPKVVPLTSAASDEGTLPARAPIFTPFMDIYPSRQWSDADVAESRGGEGTGFLIGLGSTVYDAGWNLGRIQKNWSTDPKYRIDVDETWGHGSPVRRTASTRGWARFNTLGSGARNQNF